MTFAKTSLLAATAIAATAVSAPSFAQNSIAFGNGASLPAPVFRTAADCYGVKFDLLSKTGAASSPTVTTLNDFNYVSTFNPADDFDCGTQILQSDYQLQYVSTGSGDGIRGVFSHSTTFAGDIDPNTAGVQNSTIRQSFGLSETSLGTSDVNVYNNGGTVQGQTFKGQAGALPGNTWPNPYENYGPLVQVPFLIAPVAISYDPVYKKVRNSDGSISSYRFRIKNPLSDIDPTNGLPIVVGGLRLDQEGYCKIFTGQITNWNDAKLRSLNGQSLEDAADPAPSAAFSVPLQIVGRADSSGTTSLFTRHLAAVCTGFGRVDVNSNNVQNDADGDIYANSSSTLPLVLRNNNSVYVFNAANNDAPATEALGKFTTSQGNEGVARYVAFTKEPGANAGDTVVQGRVGYNGPDYILPAVLSTGANTYGLHSAALLVNTGGGAKWRMPNVKGASRAFGSVLPPQSNANGSYNAAVVANGLRTNPQDWVQGADRSVPLANPAAIPGANDELYPIVGTSNFLTYTCFRSNRQRQPVQDFLKKFTSTKVFSDPVTGVLAASGFAPLPSAWRTAIFQTFTGTTLNGQGVNLQIGTKNIAGAAPVCATIPGQGA